MSMESCCSSLIRLAFKDRIAVISFSKSEKLSKVGGRGVVYIGYT